MLRESPLYYLPVCTQKQKWPLKSLREHTVACTSIITFNCHRNAFCLMLYVLSGRRPIERRILQRHPSLLLQSLFILRGRACKHIAMETCRPCLPLRAWPCWNGYEEAPSSLNMLQEVDPAKRTGNYEFENEGKGVSNYNTSSNRSSSLKILLSTNTRLKRHLGNQALE